MSADGNTFGLRHDLNNQLGALLAEAQLLELQELPAETAASARRIVALCRAAIALSRQLAPNASPSSASRGAS